MATDVVTTLKAERERLRGQLSALDKAIAVLEGTAGRPGKRWHMPAEAKAKISKAQKARWAKIRSRKKGDAAKAK